MAKGHSTGRVQTCTIYFFRVAPDGPIKIGRTSGFPETRLSGLQTAMPFTIVPIGVINRACPQDEGVIHRRFGRHRIRGEWFRPDPEILDYIAAFAAPWDRPPARPSIKSGRGVPEPIVEDALAESRPIEGMQAIRDRVPLTTLAVSILTAAGMSAEQIATVLRVDPKSVRNYRRRSRDAHGPPIGTVPIGSDS